MSVQGLHCLSLIFWLQIHQQVLTLKLQSQQLSSALSSACDFKSQFCKQNGPRSDCSSRSSLIEEQSDQGSHCLPVCKNRFEKFARIFSRRHKQMAFSEADFLDVLRVKTNLFKCWDKYDGKLWCLNF